MILGALYLACGRKLPVRGDGSRRGGFGAPSVPTFVVGMGHSLALRGIDGPLEFGDELLTQQRRPGLRGN
jgi:hypothetical protein